MGLRGIKKQAPRQTHKQHASLQDECERFIFRPLGLLLCSGFTERMRELSCPLLAFEWGVGLLLWPPSRRLVSKCRSEQRWTPTKRSWLCSGQHKKKKGLFCSSIMKLFFVYMHTFCICDLAYFNTRNMFFSCCCFSADSYAHKLSKKQFLDSCGKKRSAEERKVCMF